MTELTNEELTQKIHELQLMISSMAKEVVELRATIYGFEDYAM